MKKKRSHCLCLIASPTLIGTIDHSTQRKLPLTPPIHLHRQHLPVNPSFIPYTPQPVSSNPLCFSFNLLCLHSPPRSKGLIDTHMYCWAHVNLHPTHSLPLCLSFISKIINAVPSINRLAELGGEGVRWQVSLLKSQHIHYVVTVLISIKSTAATTSEIS